MGIIGLTDQPTLRRDGKIRSGYKEGNKLINTDYFILDDAPGLEEVLGKNPKEIYCTVYSPTDHREDFHKLDLRWYNSSQLLCKSMHNAPDLNGQDMGSVAAYFGVGSDVQGLQQAQFPRMNRARTRICNYKGCPDFKTGKCTEHMFLDIIIPQFSMGSIFTIDSTSINAVLNTLSGFEKAKLRFGRLSGSIFKIFKAPGEITYQKQDGSQGKREAQIVHITPISFGEYEAAFRSKIKPEDWASLMALRSTALRQPSMNGNLLASPPSQEEYEQLNAPRLPPPVEEGAAVTEIPELTQDDLSKRANDPAIVPLFEEYGRLIGREATPEVRMATMKNIPSVEAGITYLKNKIKEVKKKANKQETTPAAQTPPQPPPVEQGGAVQPGGLY